MSIVHSTVNATPGTYNCPPIRVASYFYFLTKTSPKRVDIYPYQVWLCVMHPDKAKLRKYRSRKGEKRYSMPKRKGT